MEQGAGTGREIGVLGKTQAAPHFVVQSPGCEDEKQGIYVTKEIGSQTGRQIGGRDCEGTAESRSPAQ